MLKDGNRSAPFDVEAFDRAHSEILELTGRLPKGAVRSLAEEVVIRLSRRVVVDSGGLPEPTADEITALCEALTSESAEASAEMLMGIRAEVASLERLYLVYLAAAARQLGVMWENDEKSFAEVTVGVGRIYAAMRATKARRDARRAPPEKFAVFASVPDETHTLGITMAADIFRERGWQIDLCTGCTHEEILDMVEQVDCELIGISASSRRSLPTIARLIVALRLTKPECLILIAGKIAEIEPDLVRLSGADFATSELETAYTEMQRIWDARHPEHG